MEKITLNEDQKLVLEKLKDFIESDKQHMLLMEGAAGCLGADTQLVYKRGKRRNGKPLTIKELYEKFHQIAKKQSWRLEGIPTYLKSFNPETGEIVYNVMTDIWMSGVKDLFLLKTETGKELKLTMSHPVLTPSGFKKLEELQTGDEIIVQDDREYIWNKEYTEIDKISSIDFFNTEETYDISMKSPLNNYVLKNGIIVHNSGKTTTVTKFIEWLLEETNIAKIAMASPTHKALKIMTEMCPNKYKGSIVFSTLHSMLGLKHEITKDGKEIFVRDKNVMTKFPFYELVIIDESSMIADQLFNEMEDQNYRKIKVLFVGDSNQINPVNHKMSIPMLEEKRKEFNIGHCRLEKIVRQAEDNPIIAYSQKIINSTFSFTPGEKEMVGDSGVVMLSESQNKILQQLLQYYFGSSRFDGDANYCKVIAWRNTTVEFYNKFVRNFKYGSKAGKIVLDEKLIADRPIKNDDDKVSFSTNEDLVVKNIEIKEKKLFDNDSWIYYDCLVQGMDKSDNIHILHEKEEKRYSDTLRKLSKEAVDEKETSSRLKKWRKYYSFMENFAQVKYNYAITCHNSQGSTYENCFVVQSDIDLNRNEEEKRRILYTAFTRPRKMLYIL